MAGKFEIYKDKAGEFRFRLKAANGENILASEGYKAKDSCKKGIASVQKNAGDASRFEVTATAGGKHRFSMKSGNNQVIGTSQNYASAAAAQAGIKSVGNAAPGAAIDDKA